MVDLHLHLENYEYTPQSIAQFLLHGSERGISEFGFSEHSHHFKQFKDMYFRNAILDESDIGEFQQRWLNQGKKSFIYDLDDYVELIETEKSKGHPIKLGIEVCYFPGEEEFLKNLLAKYPFDYIIGSVHWLNGWAFDMKAELWQGKDVDAVFSQYLDHFVQSIESRLFQTVAHPFSCQVFGAEPKNFDWDQAFLKIALAAKANQVAIEMNSGLAYRYPFKRITPPIGLLLKGSQLACDFSLGSDAHKAEDCGRGLAYFHRLSQDLGLNYLVNFCRLERIEIPLKDEGLI